MKKLILTISMLLLFWTPAMAASDIDISPDRRTITIEDVGADWDFLTYFPEYPDGLKVYSIRFHPGATDDLCSIENKDRPEVKYFLVKCADTYDDRIQYYSKALKMKLYLDYDDTDSTWTAAYTAGCSVTIQLWQNQD